MLDSSMTLADGRVLAFTDLGEQPAPAVVYFHGTPTSRLDHVHREAELTARGLRLISPDRPGCGRSSPQPGRRLEDWPRDVAALVDHLGIERFAVLGVSGGAPYALVTAAMLAERVVSVGILAGVTDFGWPEAWNGYPVDEAEVMRLGDEVEALRWCEERYGADGRRFADQLPELAPADLATLEDEVLAGAFATTIAEAFRQGVAGFAQDLTVQGRPWAFDAASITAPVRVLHGGADTLVPVAHAQHTADVVPHADLRICSDHGHVSVVTVLPQLASDLVATLAP